MASGLANLRNADAFTCHAFVQALGGCRTAHAPTALAGFHSVYYGAYPAENDHRRSACRIELRLGSVLQPGSTRPGGGSGGRSACRRSFQYLPCTSLLSRNLFSDAGQVAVAASRSREPPDRPETAQRGNVFMDPPKG